MPADDGVAAFLGALPSLAFAFVLVLCRAGTAIMMMPALGETELPAMVRAGLSLALAALLLPIVAPMVSAAPDSALQAAGFVTAELVSGGVLGWLARIAVLALPVAGTFISYTVGLSNVLQTDPSLGQSTALTRMMNVAVPVVVLGSGLYALPLQALVGSYRLVPPGTLLPVADSAQAAVAAAAECFSLALRIAAPFVLAGLAWQVALALLARLVPQMQVFSLSAPGQILGGLFLLALLSSTLLGLWGGEVRTAFLALPGL